MEKYLKLISRIHQSSDYSAFLLMEKYEAYELFHLLSLIKEETLNQKKLAKKLGMTEPALSMKLRNLEKDALICKKKSSEDKRNYILVLTPKGEEILNKNMTILNIEAKKLFENFSEAEFDSLMTLIDKLNEHGFR